MLSITFMKSNFSLTILLVCTQIFILFGLLLFLVEKESSVKQFLSTSELKERLFLIFNW